MMGCFPHGHWDDETDDKKDKVTSELAPVPEESPQEKIDRLWRAIVDASQT